MEETKTQFVADLLIYPADLLVSIWIIDRIPVLFEGDRKAYANWRRDLASDLGVDPSALLVMGSAAFGVSLNPHKNYKFFNEESDIDVAVVSEYHFSEGWRTLRNMGARRHAMSQRIKQSIDDHVKRYIYWGTIATDKLLHLFPYGKQWALALEKAANTTPTLGRKVNIRVYRDFDSLRSYHVANLNNLRTEELAKGVE